MLFSIRELNTTIEINNFCSLLGLEKKLKKVELQKLFT